MSKPCAKNMGNDLLVIPCDLPVGHEGPCERNVWPVSAAEQGAQESMNARPHLVYEARKMILSKYDAWRDDPDEMDFDAAFPDKWVRHAINAVLDLEAASERIAQTEEVTFRAQNRLKLAEMKLAEMNVEWRKEFCCGGVHP